MDDQDPPREPKPAPRDISTTPMVGKPSDFDFPPMTDLTPETLDHMLDDAFPGFCATRVSGRILAASNGETLESPMADLPHAPFGGAL